MRDEYVPLAGSGGRSNLSLSRKPVGDLHGQVSGRPKLCDILLCNGGSHPPTLRAGSGHDGEAWSNGVKPWVLGLEVGEVEERFGVNKDGPWLLYKGSGYRTPPPKPENPPIPKESFQWNSWVTHTRINKNPAIRGHDLCFDKTCQ